MVDINTESTTTSGLNFYYLPYLNLTFEEPFVVFDTSYDFNFNFSSDEIYILKSATNLFNSIWCDPDASLSKGRIYIGSEKDLTILNRREGQAYIEDYYSKTLAGSSTEPLIDDGVSDINVVFST